MCNVYSSVCVCVLTSEGVRPERQQGQGQGQVPHTGVGLEQSHQRQQHIAQEHWVVTGGGGGGGGGICILYIYMIVQMARGIEMYRGFRYGCKSFVLYSDSTLYPAASLVVL